MDFIYKITTYIQAYRLSIPVIRVSLGNISNVSIEFHSYIEHFRDTWHDYEIICTRKLNFYENMRRENLVQRNFEY